MSTALAGFLIALLVFSFLQIVVRIIFALENTREQDDNYLAPQKGNIPQEGKETVLASIKWLFVYTKFLTSCLLELWVIRAKQIFFKLISFIRTNRIFELNVKRKVSSLKNSVFSSINKTRAQKIFAKEKFMKSPAKTIFAEFLLPLCNSENKTKLIKKTKRNF